MYDLLWTLGPYVAIATLWYMVGKGTAKVNNTAEILRLKRKIAHLEARIEMDDLFKDILGGFKQKQAQTHWTEKPKHWAAVLGLQGRSTVTVDEVNRAYVELAKKHHPDRGGDPRRMQELNVARDEALAQAKARA